MGSDSPMVRRLGLEKAPCRLVRLNSRLAFMAFRSKAYTPERFSSRKAQAARPAGATRPCSISRLTFAMLTLLQMLMRLRGV